MPNDYLDKVNLNGTTYDIKDTISGYTTNTGTVTSVGLSNATNGGLTVTGSPVTGSGSITVGHSNVLTSAQTTQAVYPIAIDKNGHISSYGDAVDIPTPELFVVNATITQMSNGFPTGGITDKSAREIYTASANGLLPVIVVVLPLETGTYRMAAPLAVTGNRGDNYYAEFVYENQQDVLAFPYCTLTVNNSAFTMSYKMSYVENDSCVITVSSPLSLGSSTGEIANNATIPISLNALGNIQTNGTLQTSDVAIATGDKLVITDYSDSNKVARTSLSFDTTNTSAYLRKDGTWATPAGGITGVEVDGTSVVSSGVASLATSSSHPYNASTNKLATMADVDVVNITYTLISGTDYEMNISSVLATQYASTILGEAY